MTRLNAENFKILNYFRRYAYGPIPYCMQIASGKKGDHVLIAGGTHGNEPSGVRAAVEFHRLLCNGEIALKRGKISFLLGNPKAYEKNVRYLEKDLNRAFTKDDTSTEEGRRVIEIKGFLRENSDIKSLLDLHSVSIGDFKIVVYNKENPENTMFAINISAIQLHFAFHPEHMPGTLIEEAGRYNITGLIVECGNHDSGTGVETALQHIHHLLVQHNLIDEGTIPRGLTTARITQYESILAIKPHPNFTFLVKNIETGTGLKKGQTFARDDHGDHLAPQDCFVVVPSKVMKPTDHDAGFLCSVNML